MLSRCLFILAAIFFLDSNASACPPGYLKFWQASKCVRPWPQSQSFYRKGARSCVSEGGLLLQIENSDENAFTLLYLTNGTTGDPIWIGVERDLNNTWTYADGSPLTYQNWSPGEPNMSSNSSLCAIMDPRNGLWNSSDCGFVRNAYCSIQADDLQCPDGWVYSPDTNYCYRVQSFAYADGWNWNLYNFSSAESICRRMNASLVSIHSRWENDFVYDLVDSWVIQDTDSAPCAHQWAWIGLYGTGEVGHGNWSDGTPVDYVGWGDPLTDPNNWAIGNDSGCYKQWSPSYSSNMYARYVCKMPSAGRTQMPKRN